MIRIPRSGPATLALAAMVALLVASLAAARAPAAHRPAPPRAGAARRPHRAAPADTGRAMLIAAHDSVAFDSTLGDSFAEPRLYMAWKAPHGMPGALADLELTCRDTSEVDTLYLSFETGRDLPGFYGASAKLRIHPADDDSLGAFWNFGRDGANPGGIKVQLDPDGTFPCSQPWVRPGLGGLTFEFHPWAAELMFIYAVAVKDKAPISGRTRYCLARILLDQRRCRLPGAHQPVCVEWAEAEYSGGGRDLPMVRGPARFVTLNSPTGSVCAPYRGVTRPDTWTPFRIGPEGKPPVHAAPPDSTRR